MAIEEFTTYDAVPYPSYPYARSHPNNLGAIARLLGLNPPVLSDCRVLELGCASGGNLIPMAVGLPNATFVGIDLSSLQIADGNDTIRNLGLKNVALIAKSILEFNDPDREFDYIICHGVYSWVPSDVQRWILEICRENLAPNGIAFVSYNTQPGWHLRGVVRNILSFHADRYSDDSPSERIARSRELLSFLAQNALSPESAYVKLLKEQEDLLRRHSDAYLFHEHLEEHNEPVWFLDFCDRVHESGLRYLGDAEFGSMVASTTFPERVEKELDRISSELLIQEQYMDFLRNRSFRQSLLCHSSLTPNYDVGLDRIQRVQISSTLRCDDEHQPFVDAVFANDEGLRLRTDSDLIYSTMLALSSVWPRAISFDDLVDRTEHLLQRVLSSQDCQKIATSLLSTYSQFHGTAVQFHLESPPVAVGVSLKPHAHALARYQASHNKQIASLRHDVVACTPFDRHLIPLLDGTRDREMLVEELLRLHLSKALTIEENAIRVSCEDRAREIIDSVLSQRLLILARNSLLIE